MWLLDTEDGTFHHIDRPREHRYAILSHVWQLTGEQSFQDVIALQVEASRKQSRLKRCISVFTPGAPTGNALSRASAKIRGCCALARRHGYRWVWIDSCCIDKTSSSALSEAINSMYEWYAAAGVCFAYLADVGDGHDPRLRDSQFRRSRWWTRGWTLQELIAPATVVFVSVEWRLLGTKASLAGLVEDITGIARAVLTHEASLDGVSVAQRMAWAAKRQTTRLEDKAYSLLGLFGVNMPTIYGEGANAFIRLQEEILRQVPDQSIFAWGPLLRDDAVLYKNLVPYSVSDDGRYWQSRNLFAWSPDAFVNSGGISSFPPETFQERFGFPAGLPEYTVTSYGMRSRFPLIPIQHGSSKTTFLALLGCEDADGRVIALLLYPQPETAGRFYVGHYVGRPQVPPNSYYRAVSLSKPRMEQLANTIEVRDVCIAYRASPTAQRAPLTTPSLPTFVCPCDIVVPTWVISAVEKGGFVASMTGEDNVLHITELTQPQNPAVILKAAGETIYVRIGRCQCRGRFLCVSVTGTARSSGPSTTPSRASTLVGSVDTTLSLFTAKSWQDLPPRCPADHVAAWERWSKDFACDGRIVSLTFDTWITRADMYALSIEVGTLEPSHNPESA